jgi:hypothetical protein
MLWGFRPMEALQYSLALEYGVPSGQTIQIGHSLKC